MQRDQECGGCGKTIRRGDPLLEYTLAKLDHVKVRCVECDGPAPTDLAPLPPAKCSHVFQDSTMCLKCGWVPPQQPVRQLAGLPLDWKSRQVPRDPGEDDDAA